MADPEEQKTLPDFLLMQKYFGIKTVSVTDVKQRGNRLYHGETPIHRNAVRVPDREKTSTRARRTSEARHARNARVVDIDRSGGRLHQA